MRENAGKCGLFLRNVRQIRHLLFLSFVRPYTTRLLAFTFYVHRASYTVVLYSVRHLYCRPSIKLSVFKIIERINR